MNDYLFTFFSAMLPLTELRGSIPYAMTRLHMAPATAFVLSVAGNLVPMFFILYLLGPLERTLSRRSPRIRRFFEWLFSRTRNKFSDKYYRYGALALAIFVAVPLPMTGVWTGAIAAWLFNIKKSTSIIYISVGAAAAGVIVTLVTLGIRFGLSL